MSTSIEKVDWALLADRLKRVVDDGRIGFGRRRLRHLFRALGLLTQAWASAT